MEKNRHVAGDVETDARTQRSASVAQAIPIGRDRADTDKRPEPKREGPAQIRKQPVPAILAHTVPVVLSHRLTRREPYRDLGEADSDHPECQHVERRLIRRLERLGSALTRAPPTPGPDVAA